MVRPVSFTLNGEPVRVTTEDERMLLWVLRYDLGLTGTKYGCGEGLCGACSVIVNREAVRSCSTKIKDVAGKQVLTIEGLSRDGHLHPLQRAFLERHAFQCGYCTSGQIMAAEGLLRANSHPSREEVRLGMSGNLCRCGAYAHIVRAVEKTAELKGSRGAR